jgi:threonine dehydratase
VNLDYGLVERCCRIVQPRVRATPLIRSDWLSDSLGSDVWLKCENLQVTGSFKVRGALAAVEGARTPVVAASAGNHGLGLAYAARAIGVGCTVFVPRNVARVKAEAIRALGAELVVAPCDGYDATQDYALQRVGGGTWVSPCDDPLVIAGNGGTTAMELIERGFDTIVAPCGGGGLAIGAGIVAHRHGARVVGVNTDASAGMYRSRLEGRALTRLESAPTIAEGIEGGVSEAGFRLGLEYIDDVVLVPESSIGPAVVEVLRRERMLIEGSAAAGVAAVLRGLVPRGRVCVVLTGSNIDEERVKGLLNAGRAG